MTDLDAPKIHISYERIAYEELSEDLQQVHNIWEELRQGKCGPRRQEIDLMAFPSHLVPFTSIADYETDSDKFRFRFFGSGFVQANGLELTGKCIEDLPAPAVRQVINDIHHVVVSERVPVLAKFYSSQLSHKGPFVIGGRWPLCEDGETVNSVLSVVKNLQDLHILHDKIEASTQNPELNGEPA